MAARLKRGATFGNVQLVRRIGAGAMGSVWLADHLTLGTRVAVKFIGRADLESDSVSLARFHREAELVAKLKSPFVVQVLDRAATPSGSPYIVMELVEGETLSRLLQRVDRASLELTRRVVDHTCRALTRSHALGIVHRDIKPDNIFVTLGEEGVRCKVFDFGIAKQQFRARGEALTNTGSMVGTPAYMSPEQFADSSKVDEFADLWSLAVVAYHCLTGERPFAGLDLVELCANILRGSFLPPSQSRPGLPPEVDAWFLRAFQPKRELRFASASDMGESFRAALGDLGKGEPAPGEVRDALDETSAGSNGDDQGDDAPSPGTPGTAGALTKTTAEPVATVVKRTLPLALGAGALAAALVSAVVVVRRPSAADDAAGASVTTKSAAAPADVRSAGAPAAGARTAGARTTGAPAAGSAASSDAPTAAAPTSTMGEATAPATAAPNATTGPRDASKPSRRSKTQPSPGKLDYNHGF